MKAGDTILRWLPNQGVWRERLVHRRTSRQARAWLEMEGKTGPNTWWEVTTVYRIRRWGASPNLAVSCNHRLTPDTARQMASDLVELSK